eukprot:5731743-Amphidinium_carterae.1
MAASLASHPELLSFHNWGNTAIPSILSFHFWHQWQPIQSCHSIMVFKMATHPKLLFHELGGNDIPSRDVIP